jgi:hypothetical protein
LISPPSIGGARPHDLAERVINAVSLRNFLADALREGGFVVRD